MTVGLKSICPSAPRAHASRCHIAPARRRIVHFANRPAPRSPFRRFPFRFLDLISTYIFYIQKAVPEYKYCFLPFCISFIYLGCIISIYLERNSTSKERLFMYLVFTDDKVLICDKKDACKHLKIKPTSFNQALSRNKGHFEMKFKNGYARPIGCIDITGTDLDGRLRDEMV